jgi:hypothetical protein
MVLGLEQLCGLPLPFENDVVEGFDRGEKIFALTPSA